jgi:hypothetical protein
MPRGPLFDLPLLKRPNAKFINIYWLLLNNIKRDLDYNDRTGIKISERNPNPKRLKEKRSKPSPRSYQLQASLPEKVQLRKSKN